MVLALLLPASEARAELPPVFECRYPFCCNDYGIKLTVSPDGSLWVAGHTSVSSIMWARKYLDCDLVDDLYTHAPRGLQPTGIAVDDSGFVYIARSDCDCITRLSEPPVVWGDSVTLGQLSGIAIDGGFLYTADRGNHRVRKFLLDGTPVASFATTGELSGPNAIDVDREGHIYVTHSSDDHFQKYTTDGVLVTEWSVYGGIGEFVTTTSISADGRGGVFVSFTGDSARIQKFTDNGEFVTSWSLPEEGVWPHVYSVAADRQGAIYATSGFDLFKFREGDPTAVDDSPGSQLTMERAGPNPFRSQLRFSWSQPEAGAAEVSLIDVSGRRIATLASGIWPAGRHQVAWSVTEAPAADLTAGVYWIRIRTSGREVSRSVIHVR